MREPQAEGLDPGSTFLMEMTGRWLPISQETGGVLNRPACLRNTVKHRKVGHTQQECTKKVLDEPGRILALISNLGDFPKKGTGQFVTHLSPWSSGGLPRQHYSGKEDRTERQELARGAEVKLILPEDL